MADVWLISGIPGAGKTTVARLLAERFERSEGDLLQGRIVSGNVWPGQQPAGESARQIRLNMRNQGLLTPPATVDAILAHRHRARLE